MGLGKSLAIARPASGPPRRSGSTGSCYKPSDRTKSDLYSDLLPLINGRQTKLLDGNDEIVATAVRADGGSALSQAAMIRMARAETLGDPAIRRGVNGDSSLGYKSPAPHTPPARARRRARSHPPRRGRRWRPDLGVRRLGRGGRRRRGLGRRHRRRLDALRRRTGHRYCGFTTRRSRCSERRSSARSSRFVRDPLTLTWGRSTRQPRSPPPLF